MYRILLADDEPMALAMMEKLLERRSRDYHVVGRAGHGRQALEMTLDRRPDLLITDIRMPLMDGLELVRAAKQQLPDLYVILVSGYQDFEYARQAIRNGANDYLLKPIVPSKFFRALDVAEPVIDEARYALRDRVLEELCSGREVRPEDLEHSFPSAPYNLMLLRFNGLPQRFHPRNGGARPARLKGNTLSYGRDEQEGLFFFPASDWESGKAAALARNLGETFFTNAGAYYTALYVAESIPPKNFAAMIPRLYKSLMQCSVVGQTQIIQVPVEGDLPSASAGASLLLEQDCLQHIRILLDAGRWDDFRNYIRTLHANWHQEKRAQLWVEGIVRSICGLLARYASGEEKENPVACSIAISDIFNSAGSWEELADSLLEVYEGMLAGSVTSADPASETFFRKILAYMTNHMSNDLGLQDICEHFALSQTSVSRLFRQYQDASFVQVLTRMRMEKAKALMLHEPDLLIRDVAAWVGYQDQFYFSRVFRSYAGMAPSAWLEANRTGNSSDGGVSP